MSVTRSDTRADRRIVTFYSFKGGVGRSMALANVAFRLANRSNLDVIVVDWDLEAPGLHRFFGISDEVAATQNGLLEYLLAWREAVEDDAEAPPDATGWLIPVVSPMPAHGSVSLLLAGKLDEGYADRLRSFDWQPFYRFNAGAAAIETLRKQLAGKADMVLVDSRTGVTDAGGVCTVQMPDGVVLMTAANEQSFAGIERVARAIAAGEERAGRERARVWVTVARAPYLDVPEGESWFDKYGSRFDEGYEARLWAKGDHPRGLRSHRLPHVGRWGFGEQVLDTRLEDDDPLAKAYGALSDELLQWATGKEKPTRSHDKITVRTIDELRNEVEQAEQRSDFAGLGGALFELGGALAEAGELTNATEMFQKAAGIQFGRELRGPYALTLVFLGQVLESQGRRDEAMAELRRALATFRALDFRHGESLALGAMAVTSRNDPDRAEELYQSAMEADPENATNLGNHALFYKEIRKDFNKAEELYRKAIDADPEHAHNLGGYAIFLSDVRKNFDKAEEFYKRAIIADPNYAHNLGAYAIFLSNVRKDFDDAEQLYERATDADPKHATNLGAYATFLSDVRNNFDKAEELYNRAIAADPKQAYNLGAYATFLVNVRKSFDHAEEIYKRAIEADPKHGRNLGSYAIFSANIRKDIDKAEELFRQAIDADPNHVHNLGAYALFLWNVRKNFDDAEKFFKRAILIDPTRADILGAYATFLSNIRKDYENAENIFKRAIALDLNHANNILNYSGILLAVGRQTDGLSLLERALDVPESSLSYRAECWFYALAHCAPARRSEALAQLKKLIVSEGARSPGWDLTRNVERALSDGHPDAMWLALLADVIGEKAEPAVLDAWPAWAAA